MRRTRVCLSPRSADGSRIGNYTTVLGGSQAIHVLQPFDRKRIVPYLGIAADKQATGKPATSGGQHCAAWDLDRPGWLQ